MDVPTITMPRSEARDRLRSYRRALHRRADAEYEAAARGYEQLAAGRALIDLGAVFRAAPLDHAGRPQLAIARSDRKQVRLDHPSQSPVLRFWSHERWHSDDVARDRFPTLLREVNVGRLGSQSGDRWSSINGYALVPLVPPKARAQAKNRPLKKCFTLWEVEEWADSPLRVEPDRDPLLLEHVGGDLYAVLAAWDLTDLERAILGGRRIS